MLVPKLRLKPSTFTRVHVLKAQQYPVFFPRLSSEQMIEYQRSEKYRADRGFSVTVAGLINMKPTGAFKPPKLYKVDMAANERQ